MSRMLKALQRIELTRPAVPPVEAIRGPDAMEATLAQAENAIGEFGAGNSELEGAHGIPTPGEDEAAANVPDEQLTPANVPDGQFVPTIVPGEPQPIQISDQPAAEVITPPNSTTEVDQEERWRRFVAAPAASIAAPPARRPLMPDRSCVSPMLRPLGREPATRTVSAEPAAENPAPYSVPPQPPRAARAVQPGMLQRAPVASRAGLGKVGSILTGEYAELGRMIVGQLGLSRPAAVLLASADGEIRRGISLFSLATMLRQQIEGEVALVGCDWRSESAAGRYGISAERGLVDLLGGAGRGIKAMQKVGRPPISVLLGRGYASQGQLPKDFSWLALVRQLKQRYRLVILDASGASCAEAAPIAQHCDGTYLLVTRKHTPRRDAKRAVSLLGSSNAQLLGCLLVTG